MSFEPTQGPNQSPRASITQDKLATQKSAGQKCCLLLPVQEDPSVGGPHFLLLNVRQWGRSGAKCGASHPQLKVSLIAGDVRPELFGKKKKKIVFTVKHKRGFSPFHWSPTPVTWFWIFFFRTQRSWLVGSRHVTPFPRFWLAESWKRVRHFVSSTEITTIDWNGRWLMSHFKVTWYRTDWRSSRLWLAAARHVIWISAPWLVDATKLGENEWTRPLKKFIWRGGGLWRGRGELFLKRRQSEDDDTSTDKPFGAVNDRPWSPRAGATVSNRPTDVTPERFHVTSSTNLHDSFAFPWKNLLFASDESEGHFIEMGVGAEWSEERGRAGAGQKGFSWLGSGCWRGRKSHQHSGNWNWNNRPTEVELSQRSISGASLWSVAETNFSLVSNKATDVIVCLAHLSPDRGWTSVTSSFCLKIATALRDERHTFKVELWTSFQSEF